MAKTTQPAYDATAQYKVELLERINLYGQTFYPGQDVTLRGDVLGGIDPAHIKSATPVSEI